MNNWRRKCGGAITNKEDFVKLDQLNAELDVAWVNISAPALRHAQPQQMSS